MSSITFIWAGFIKDMEDVKVKMYFIISKAVIRVKRCSSENKLLRENKEISAVLAQIHVAIDIVLFIRTEWSDLTTLTLQAQI